MGLWRGIRDSTLELNPFVLLMDEDFLGLLVSGGI